MVFCSEQRLLAPADIPVVSRHRAQRHGPNEKGRPSRNGLLCRMGGGSGRRLWLPPVRWTIRRRLIGERWRRRGHRVAGGSEWTLGHAAPAREVRRSRVIGDILIFPLFRFAHCFYYPRRLRAGSVVITVVLAGAGRVNQAAQKNQQTDRFPRLRRPIAFVVKGSAIGPRQSGRCRS